MGHLERQLNSGRMPKEEKVRLAFKFMRRRMISAFRRANHLKMPATLGLSLVASESALVAINVKRSIFGPDTKGMKSGLIKPSN